MALAQIAAFEFPWQAHLFKGFLESEEIQAFVIGEEHIRLYWPISNALGGVRVYVHSNNKLKATKLYQSFLTESFEENLRNEFPDYEPTSCQQCGSQQLDPIYNSIRTLLFFLAIGPAPGKIIGYRCEKCNVRINL